MMNAGELPGWIDEGRQGQRYFMLSFVPSWVSVLFCALGRALGAF
jgi:hypothetical protein